MAALIGEENEVAALEREKAAGEQHRISMSCQEGLSCRGQPATFYCRECDSYQCDACEAALHSSRELKRHSRERFQSAGGGGASCQLWCSPRNAPVLSCRECGVVMCAACDGRMHGDGGRRNEHVRESIAA